VFENLQALPCEWRKWMNHHSYITTHCGGLAPPKYAQDFI